MRSQPIQRRTPRLVERWRAGEQLGGVGVVLGGTRIQPAHVLVRALEGPVTLGSTAVVARVVAGTLPRARRGAGGERGPGPAEVVRIRARRDGVRVLHRDAHGAVDVDVEFLAAGDER